MKTSDTTRALMQQIRFVGHRGLLNRYPENSLISIDAALRSLCSAVEFDVQMTSDLKLVVAHDADLKRTANADISICHQTLTELSAYSVHQADKFCQRFFPTPIPSLDDIMQRVALYPDKLAVVEIKSESLTHFGHKTVFDQLQSVLAPFTNQVLVIAFDREFIRRVKTQSDFATGWILQSFDNVSKCHAEKLDPDYLICNKDKPEDHEMLWAGRWQWIIYIIDNTSLAKQWIHRGADLLEINDDTFLSAPED